MLPKAELSQRSNCRTKNRMFARKSFFMNRWFPWLVALIVVFLLAIIFGYQGYFSSLHDKDPVTLHQSITWQLEWWYLWLALSPFILLLARKFPITRLGG